MTEPARVAIIGGGCGGMAAAYQLTRPELAGRFEVTLFQQGWRLGGKGASGRGASGRIEEHGLHVWLGYYENSFRMMRETYAALAADPDGSPYGDWREAFVPEPDIGLMAPDGDGGWGHWRGRFPPAPGLPGDPDPPAMTLGTYTLRALAMLETLLLDVESGRGAATRGVAPEAGQASVTAAVARWLARGTYAGALVAAEGLAILQAAIASLPDRLDGVLRRFVDRLFAVVRKVLDETLLARPDWVHVHAMAELVVASVVGILRDGLITDPRGLDAIDHEDSRAWLKRHGAGERALASPFLTGLYDLGMAYAGGDPARPGFAAGVGLRATLRLFFSYRGAVFWRMRAGMGDCVFAPLHDLLAHRGVTFAFFHRLTNIGLGDDGAHVARLDFDVQAQLAEGCYRPLVEVAGRPCWPSEPLWGQLADGERMRAASLDLECYWSRHRVGQRQLHVGRDFDFVVLATGLGAVPHVAGDLLAASPRWRAMVEKVATIETQAFQAWLREDIDTLGWKGPPYIATAFAKPFDTWCDMAHVIPEEAWDEPPATALYFCAALADAPDSAEAGDAGYPARRAAEVEANARRHLEGPVRHLIPGAFDASGGFRWSLLADAGRGPDSDGPERFRTQYWRANVNPSDRYTLSLPGTTQYRISPLEIQFDNLTIAGDWTECGLNSGCTEGAVISGMLAAHALSGRPELEDIIGFDHP